VDIHGEDVVLDLDRLMNHRSMAVQSSMSFDLVKFMHDPVSWDVDIDSIEKLACQIIFRVFDAAIMITDFVDLDIRRTFRDECVNSFSDAHIGKERSGVVLLIINII